MKDKDKMKAPIKRYQDKLQKKYENAWIHHYSKEAIKYILEKKRNFRVQDYYPEYQKAEKYKSGEYQALIADENDDFIMFVEYTHEEVKKFKEVKEVCKKDGIKDDDRVIVTYFKILEVFK